MISTALVASGVVALGAATTLQVPRTDSLSMEAAGSYDDITTRSGDRAGRGDAHPTISTAIYS